MLRQQKLMLCLTVVSQNGKTFVIRKCPGLQQIQEELLAASWNCHSFYDRHGIFTPSLFGFTLFYAQPLRVHINGTEVHNVGGASSIAHNRCLCWFVACSLHSSPAATPLEYILRFHWYEE